MTMGEGMTGEARVRWLVAGAFTTAPSGRKFVLTPDSLPQAMADAGLSARVTVKDRLSAGDLRSVEVSFTKPKSFTLAEVVLAVPELKALRALADDLGSADASRRPSPDAALSRVVATVGEGRLAEAVASALGIAKSPVPAASPVPAKPQEGDAVEAILAMGEIAKPKPVVSAINAFVREMRAADPASAAKPAPASSSGAKAARTVIEAAVFATAADVLRDPAVARLESAWRGLKLLVDQCSASSGMSVEAVDVGFEGIPAAIEAALGGDPVDMPDAIIVADACDDVARLETLAGIAEQAHAPVIVAVPPTLFGVNDPAEVSLKIEEEGAGLPDSWSALRKDESSRWLCAVTNRVVLCAEGTGDARRACFGSASLALGAMLAASYRITGSFARILGTQGALKAPATVEITAGREAGNAVPTEAFFSVRAQARLASLGFVGLGSGRNTDAVVVTNAPTVRAGDDLVPLPAQILTGRIVRFALWVRDQIPAGAGDAEVGALFEQAAGVFLFPGSTDAGLSAKVVTTEGKREVVVTATVRPEHAGIPFHLAFALPLAN